MRALATGFAAVAGPLRLATRGEAVCMVELMICPLALWKFPASAATTKNAENANRFIVSLRPLNNHKPLAVANFDRHGLKIVQRMNQFAEIVSDDFQYFTAAPVLLLV
jgi:hypothetical protein